MTNCDFGSPCDCRECTEMHRRDICDICKEGKTIFTNSRRDTDRKGMSGYSFTNYCKKCWNEKKKADEIERKKGEEERRKKDEKRALLEEKLRPLENEPTPIKNAVKKSENKYKLVIAING